MFANYHIEYAERCVSNEASTSIVYVGGKKCIFPSQIKTFDKQNYKSVIANFEITDEKKNVISLYPEIRIYNQPNILTSEADIISTIFFDKFIVINLLKGEEIFNVRYQTKPFMIWIWISVCLISIGGMLALFKRH